MASPAAVLNILVTANTKAAQAQLVGLDKQMTRTQATANKTAARIGTLGSVAAVGIAGGLAYAVKKAADFEEQMSRLGAVSDANRKEMKRFEKQAKEAGAATKFSALEAAEAQTELAKGGLSVQRIMRGGLKSALALAAAGEMDLAEAAATTVNAMKLFGLRGRDAMKVADGLATAANQTTADVSDFALALKQGGAAAKIAGLDFSGTVTILEALAEAGVKGTDAGTSMKSFFINIATPSVKAKKAMKELGVEIFNAQGDLKSLPAISKNLQQAFGDLTQEQFINKAGTIAGSDAIRTLYALYDAGPQKLQKLEGGLKKEGTAADVAKKKQDNLKGSIENLMGSVETIAIGIGQKLLPQLTDFARKVTRILNAEDLKGGEKFQRVIDLIVQKLTDALPKIADVGVKVAGALASGFASAWRDMNPLAKLFTAAVLIRVLGGRGAVAAAGLAIGKLLGGGIAGGVASSAAGGAAGAAGAGGFAGLLAKGKSFAKSAGWLAVGVTAADALINEMGRRAEARGPDIFKALAAQGDAGLNVLGANVGQWSENLFRDLKQKFSGVFFWEDWGGKMETTAEKARRLSADLRKIANSEKGITSEHAEKLRRRLEELGDVSPQARRAFNLIVGGAEDLGEKMKWLQGRFENMRTGASRSVKELATRVQYNTGVIAQVMDKNSARGKRAMGENFAAAAQNVKLMMRAGVVSTKEGTRLIEQYMVKALQTMGFSKKEALMVRKGQDPYTGKAIGGKQNLTGKQRGGPINIGAASGDSVPAMLERGEYVLNRNAVSKVGRGNLDRVNFASAPRFQQGGIVELLHPGNDPDHQDHLHVAMETSAQVVALGRKLQKLGWIVGEHPAFGPVGGHATNSYHYSGRAIDVNWPDASQEAAKIAALLPMLGSSSFGGAIKPAPELKRLMVDGPDSALKSVVQGALDVSVGGANAVIGRANTLVTAEGSEDLSGFTGGGNAAANRALGKRMAAAFGWSGDQWSALDKLWIGESGWINQMNQAGSGATGIPQALPGSKMASEGADWATNPATQIAWGLKYIKSVYGDPVNAYNTWLGRSPHWYKKGGPVGYAGDSLGVGTAPALRSLFGDDRNVQAAVSGGKSPQWGLGALKGLGKKKAHYVFDFGSNEYGSVGIMQALRQAKQYVGDKLLHTFTLNAGETEANKRIRGFGGASVIDWANKHGPLGDGLHGDYGHRARLVADSIKKASKAKKNKPKPHGKLKKRKHLSGLQAPGVNKLHNTVDALMYGDQAARSNALHGLLDHVHGTGLPEHVTDRIAGLTLQAEIAGDYVDRVGQFTTEEGGAVFPGDIGGKTELDFLQQQLDALFALRNRLVAAHEAVQARREQMKKLADTARKHLEFYARAVTAWGHARKVKEKELERLKKKPKQNKEQIGQVKALLGVIDEDQVKRVRTRDALKNRIIPALDTKRSALGDYARDTIAGGLVDVQGVGSPMNKMTQLPALGVLGGSILTAQVNLARLKAGPATSTDAATDIASDRDELLKEIGRLTLQRSAVEKLHEITLRDFPEFDRLGAPFGGKFHTGGIVPGPVGAEATTVLQGGEGVFTRDQMAAMGSPSVTINVAPGMEWLKQFISVEVGRNNRSTARNAGRGLPGRGGGNLG